MADATFDVPTLEGICRRVLVALGTPEDLATTVATSLVLSNLVGHDSHGIVRLSQYAGMIRSGQVDPAARPHVDNRRGAVATIDGGWGFGQPAAQLATSVVVEAARSMGVGMVAIRSCNHIGRLGEYVTSIARSGQMGMAFCNAGAVVAPFGGAGRALGTNPFAWAVPRRGEDPIFADFATSGIAEGKLNIARGEGRAVALGYVIDAEGRPSTNPEDFYAGGSLLPFGAHKGSGMSMLIELSAGLLSGMGASCMATFGGGNGTLVMATDVGAFIPLDDYMDQVDVFCSELNRQAAPRDGGEVLLPGEVEFRTKAGREPDHIPVGVGVRRPVTVLAGELGVDIGEFALAERSG
jgi:LDH2 family malate/lactate/ureidoglycolate dehydrogenase